MASRSLSSGQSISSTSGRTASSTPWSRVPRWQATPRSCGSCCGTEETPTLRPTGLEASSATRCTSRETRAAHGGPSSAGGSAPGCCWLQAPPRARAAPAPSRSPARAGAASTGGGRTRPREATAGTRRCVRGCWVHQTGPAQVLKRSHLRAQETLAPDEEALVPAPPPPDPLPDPRTLAEGCDLTGICARAECTAVLAQCKGKGMRGGRCSGCLSARYCSAACQAADWQFHKQHCTSSLVWTLRSFIEL